MGVREIICSLSRQTHKKGKGDIATKVDAIPYLLDKEAKTCYYFGSKMGDD
jgi:hypothetical protein